jgi:membrane protease subunit HflC
MESKKKYVLLFVLLIIASLAASVYVVNQTEQAIVLQFGEPVRVVKDAGLKFKVPFIQNVVYYDNRLLNLDPPAQEIVLNDKKRLDVDSFTRYKIVDPLKFYKTVRTEYQANSKLEEIVNSSIRKVLGKITLPELLSSQRTEIMADISSAVKKDAEQIGVSVADVRIRRADLPVEVLQAINARMKAERERDAKEFRAKGQQAAQQIRATAEKEKVFIIAEAQKEAEIIKGQGDKEVIELWNNAAALDTRFYDFYRSLEAYKKSLQDGTKLLISPNSEFFKFLQDERGFKK